MPVQSGWKRPYRIASSRTFRTSENTERVACWEFCRGTRMWLLRIWNRSAEFKLALDDWAKFGLSRFSASRGLDTLEGAELVSVGRMPGRSPVVTILEAAAADE